MNELAIRYEDSPILADLPEDVREKLAELLRNRRAENTIRTYNATWRKWRDWTEQNRLPTFPARAEDLVRFLVENHQENATKATLSMFMTVQRLTHGGRADDPTKAFIVQETWKSIKRADRRPRKKARILSLTELTLCIEALNIPGNLQDIRDRALLTLGWAGAFRASELIALQWSNIWFVERGLEVTIQSSKTDQEGEGYTIAIPYYRNEYRTVCPVRALMVLDAGYRDGIIFRRVNRSTKRFTEPLSTKAVSRTVARAAERAELPGDYSAHSLRRGFATWAAGKGMDDRKIMRHGRWKSRSTVDGYVEDGTLWTDNALMNLLGTHNEQE